MNRKETYSNHGEENTGRGERDLGWRHVGHPLRAPVQGTNDHVQRGESVVLPLDFGRHEWRAGCEEESASNRNERLS